MDTKRNKVAVLGGQFASASGARATPRPWARPSRNASDLPHPASRPSHPSSRSKTGRKKKRKNKQMNLGYVPPLVQQPR